MPVLTLNGVTPRIHETCFIAPDAVIVGDVTIGPGSSVWFNAVIRGDSGPITIGANTNIQDLCAIHSDWASPAIIGDRVTVGHGVILHGCTIGNDVLVGMKSVVMDGVVIGDHCLVAAGALVNKLSAPARSLIVGAPARIRRSLTDDDIAMIDSAHTHYVELVEMYRQEMRQTKQRGSS